MVHVICEEDMGANAYDEIVGIVSLISVGYQLNIERMQLFK